MSQVKIADSDASKRKEMASAKKVAEVAEKTNIRSLLVLAWGAVNLGVNAFITPHYGLSGVIFALLVAYGGLFLTMFIYSQRCYRLPYQVFLGFWGHSQFVF